MEDRGPRLERRLGCSPSSMWYLTTEPVMFAFMASAFIKFPIFQALLYDKACFEKYGMNATICQNFSAVHADVHLQAEANHLFLISSMCLLFPSIFLTIYLGSLCDSWSIKKSMLIPHVGLLFADVNYAMQTYFMEWPVYYLMLSDVVFGCVGGFTAVIGVLFTYSVKVGDASNRSEKVAIMEGAIGLGGMLGSIFAGLLRRWLGYALVFSLMGAIHFASLLYMIICVEDLRFPTSIPSRQIDNTRESSSFFAVIFSSMRDHLLDIKRSYFSENRDPYAQRFLNLVVLALIIELIAFAGLSDILFSYVRFRFRWSVQEYGVFNGVGTGLATLAVIVFYPFLHRKLNISNAVLAAMGLVTKIAGLLVLAFAMADWLAMGSVVFAFFNRFVPTGLRSMASFYVRTNEQGKIFSLISLLEGLAFLVASLLFNGLYAYTLRLFDATMLIATALALLLPTFILIYIERHPEEKRLREEEKTGRGDTPTITTEHESSAS